MKLQALEHYEIAVELVDVRMLAKAQATAQGGLTGRHENMRMAWDKVPTWLFLEANNLGSKAKAGLIDGQHSSCMLPQMK